MANNNNSIYILHYNKLLQIN